MLTTFRSEIGTRFGFVFHQTSSTNVSIHYLGFFLETLRVINSLIFLENLGNSLSYSSKVLVRNNVGLSRISMNSSDVFIFFSCHIFRKFLLKTLTGYLLRIFWNSSRYFPNTDCNTHQEINQEVYTLEFINEFREYCRT